MNAAEAGAVRLEEPNWGTLFKASVDRKDEKYPIELREEDSFEEVLWEYRRFHFTWLPDGMRRPMPSSEAVIGLAKIGILSPRSRNKNIPRDGVLHEIDHDAHCWIQVSGRAWKITAIEAKVIFLESFGEESQIDVSRVNWNKKDGYVDKAVAMLKAAWPGV